MTKKSLLLTFSSLMVALLFPAFGSAQAQAATGGCSPQANPPALPLHTSGRWIVDRNGNVVKLSSVNWYGAEEKDFVPAGLELASLDSIAAKIRCMGFNSVRLPWSNQLVETNPVVSNAAVAANPQFDGMHAMDVFDAVVQSLARHGIMIILDNHMSNANWCCSNTDGNTLWYNAQYPESSWLADWQSLATRYAGQPMVIGADLRNEPRYNATWGGSAATDWHAAAERGGNAVLSANPNLLIFVEGVSYAGDLTGVANLPVVLDLPGHLVYEAHNYPWYQSFSTYSQLAQNLNDHWGYILTPNQPYTAPVWVGEFGTCHTTVSCFQSSTVGSYGFWLDNLLQYLEQNDVGWSYWAVNGTEASGNSRTYGAEETFGILDPYWNAPALSDQLGVSPAVNLLAVLQADMGATQGPGVQAGNPVVALTSPVNGSLYAFGNSITLAADASVAGAQVQQVAFYADGAPIGTATSAPFTFQWTGASPGNHLITAVATSTSGSTYSATSAPVNIFVENYNARDVQYGPAIDIDFVGYWSSMPGTPMASTEVAGAVPEANWNNAYGNSGSVSSLVDSTGAATQASVDWKSTNMWSLPIQDAPGNNRMMKGYQDNSNTRPTVIHVSNIPASYGSYDVYVYFDGGNGSKARAANYRIVTQGSGGNTFSGCPQGAMHSGTIISGLDAANTDFSGAFTLAAGGSAGNYVVFPNCHGTSFTLLPVHGASADGAYRAPVNGIQIISVPE